MLIITTNTIELEKTISDFQIAENYFSDILNAQLTIFSLIVAAIVALYFFFNWKISKDQIKKETVEAIKEIKNEIRKEFEEKNKNITENIAAEMTILRGEIYRTLGQYWDSQKSFTTAFIWWIRAAYNFASAGDENMTRISLSSAKESVEKIQYATQLDYKLIGEYQRLFSKIDDKIYKIEKDLLDKAIKKILTKKS
jgi:tetratricopeptide (TPR) repeat protein